MSSKMRHNLRLWLYIIYGVSVFLFIGCILAADNPESHILAITSASVFILTFVIFILLW